MSLNHNICIAEQLVGLVVGNLNTTWLNVRSRHYYPTGLLANRMDTVWILTGFELSKLVQVFKLECADSVVETGGDSTQMRSVILLTCFLG